MSAVAEGGLTLQPTPLPFDLAGFEVLIGPERTARLHTAAAALRESLGGGTLWHVNSTGAGGGVAEMLHTLLPLYRRLGMRARWAVVGGDTGFFTLAKRLGLALYGSTGDGGQLGPTERDAYLAALGGPGERLASLVRPGDVVLLHDHQTAGLVPRLARRGVRVYWRCHVGVDRPTEVSDRAWNLLAPLLDGAHGTLFSVPWHIPDRLRNGRAAVLAPFIAPFSAKNRPLDQATVRRALVRCGLRPDDGTPAGPNGGGPPVQVTGEAPPDPEEPLIAQVSRWDRLKDMHGVLAAVTDHVADGHLALVGPDPLGVPDDTEQALWFERCRAAWLRLPPAQRRRVTLVCLPMDDLVDNALLVNSIQRASTVVLQKSLAEGFGLTVTEAMWKARTVVAAGVGGIRAQVTHGRTGLLVDDPHDLPGFAELVISALHGGMDIDTLGERARQRVRADFLPDTEIHTMARLLTGGVHEWG
ncbi:glycosyltransferase [Streptomyces sp. NPDC060006]|uniref:glycosyltransferase n=1 Tax=unclassified Streptomyces TaxID=2593676 RepID=UPI0036949B4D